MPPAAPDWPRLGRLLAARRAQISPRYANRRVFSDERDVNWRTLHDLEHAKRFNFKVETLRAFETAYQLIPGSIDRTLMGGELEPLPAPSQFPETDGDAASMLFPDDPVRQALWRLRDGDGRLLPEEVRAGLVATFNESVGENRQREQQRQQAG